MAVNFKGRDYKLYLAVSAPTPATISTQYALCGNLTNVSISTSRNAIDVSTKDSGDNSAFISGRRSTTLTGSALFDHVTDSGQTHLYTALAAENGTVYFLVSDNTTTAEEFYGSGVITQYDVSFPDDDASTLDFTIQVSGAITQANGQSTT
jgi:predicted secreted protein